jgi:hypothetical protein
MYLSSPKYSLFNRLRRLSHWLWVHSHSRQRHAYKSKTVPALWSYTPCPSFVKSSSSFLPRLVSIPKTVLGRRDHRLTALPDIANARSASAFLLPDHGTRQLVLYVPRPILLVGASSTASSSVAAVMEEAACHSRAVATARELSLYGSWIAYDHGPASSYLWS